MKPYYAKAIVAASAAVLLSQGSAMARTRTHSHKAVTPVAHHQAHADIQTANDGTASYYSSRYNGRLTSSGQRYNEHELTAAHAWLPFGTKVLVTCEDTGRSVVVTVTDRLYTKRRLVDLSRSAAEELGIIRRGIAHVSITPV